MQQHPNSRTIFNLFASIFGPWKNIVEIGTGTGEWSNFLCNFADTVTSYDVVDRLSVRRRFKFIIEDVFFSDRIIKDLETCNLLICDGGNKVKEAKLFAPHLKSGSLIMVHDYGPTDDWEWCEFRKADVPSCVLELKVPSLNSVAWFLGVIR